MSYIKQTWQTGDVVTSAKLNHMEDGIEAAGGGFKVTVTVTGTPPAQTYSSDKTFEEIYEAAIGGSLPYAVISAGGVVSVVLPLASIFYGSGAFFGGALVSEDGISQVGLSIGTDGTIDIADVSYPAT